MHITLCKPDFLMPGHVLLCAGITNAGSNVLDILLVKHAEYYVFYGPF